MHSAATEKCSQQWCPTGHPVSGAEHTRSLLSQSTFTPKAGALRRVEAHCKLVIAPTSAPGPNVLLRPRMEKPVSQSSDL